MKKRAPSPSRTAKGLFRLAAEVEHRAELVREIDGSLHARALTDAARAISNAAAAIEQKVK